MQEALSEFGREPDDRENMMTAREVALRLKVSVGWVTSHASGRYKPVLPSYKMGGAVRFKWREIEEFLKRSKRAMMLGIPIQ